MSTATIESNKVLSAEEIEQIVAEFHREGCLVVPGVLSPEECAALRERTDELVESVPEDQIYNQIVLREVAAKDALFRDVLVRAPILDLAQAVLGDDCRYCGSNVIRNGPGQAISNWHVDLGNIVEFPLPPDVPRHDPRITVPVQWMTVQVALSDIETIEDGPTQFVPGSHYSGRLPGSQENPEFEGRGAVSVFCKAGDIYLTNHQNWHRGAPKTSDGLRYIMQLQYGMNWAASRFDGAMTEAVAADMRQNGDSGEALLQLLGKSL